MREEDMQGKSSGNSLGTGKRTTEPSKLSISYLQDLTVH